ncbi:MAG TPA: hypothetical protein VF482_11875 [Trebonia sp.]
MSEPRLTLAGKAAAFGRRPRLSWRRAAMRAAAFVVATAVIAASAEAGAWFLPFAAGVCAGLLSRFLGLRACLLTVLAASLLGWVTPLWWQAMSGAPVGGVARTVAALAGLPAHAPVTVGATLLVAAAQALCGLWLVRALTPRGQR